MAKSKTFYQGPHGHYKRIFEQALIEAHRSPDLRKQVGCIITDTKYEIISTGFNAKPLGVDTYHDCVDPRTGKSDVTLLHAEERAIIKAGHKLCEGNYLFVTLCPCLRCAARILEAGISKVFFLENHDDGEGALWLDKHGVKVMQVLNVRRSIDDRVRRWDNDGSIDEVLSPEEMEEDEYQ
jgi:dCMP deaminase